MSWLFVLVFSEDFSICCRSFPEHFDESKLFQEDKKQLEVSLSSIIGILFTKSDTECCY